MKQIPRGHGQTGTATNVDDVDIEFAEQHRDSELTRTLVGGTEAMRRAGAKYAEKKSDETDAQLRERLQNAYLYDGYESVLSKAKGELFTTPVLLEDADDETLEWAQNIDNASNNLTEWSKNTFADGFIDGVVFTLVDYPYIRTREVDGIVEYYVGQDDDNQEIWSIKNQQADQDNNWRPYFIRIPARDVLSCWFDVQSGNKTVTMFRYRERFWVSDGTDFGRELVERIRVYRPNKWETWERVSSSIATRNTDDYVKVAEGELTIGEVPLAVFIGGKKLTDCTAHPALQGLAEVNLRHWRSSVSHYTLKNYSDAAVWLGKNLVELGPDGLPKPLELGPGKVIHTSNSDADLRSIGIDPNTILASERDLERLEKIMDAYKGSIFLPAGGAITATQALIENKSSDSLLLTWALAFEDFLANCMHFVALWQGKNPEDALMPKVNKEFSPVPANFDFILSTYDRSLITAQTVHSKMREAGVLPDDFDSEAEIAQLANERAMPNVAFKTTLDTGL